MRRSFETEYYDKIGIVVILYNPTNEEISNIKLLSTLYKGAIIDNSQNANFSHEKINKMSYIPLYGNYGIAKAQNIGIRKVLQDASIYYIMYLDQDSNIENKYPIKMVQEFENISGAGIKLAALGATMLYKDTGETFKPLIDKEIFLTDNFIKKNDIIASGTCISRNALQTTGLNDERLFIDYVDSEWCWRAYSKGLVVGISPVMKFHHKIGKQIFHIYKKVTFISSPIRYYYQYRNYFLLLFRNYVPFKWKLRKGVNLLWEFFVIPFANKGYTLSTFKYMLKGIYCGILGKTGKIE